MNRFGVLLATNGLGLVRHRLRDLDGADSAFSAALDIAREIDDQLYLGIIRINLADVWLDLGEPERAALILRESVDLLSAAGDQSSLLEATRKLGRSLCAAGQLSEARSVLEDALAGAREYAVPVWEAHANVELARLFLAESRPADALEASQSAAVTFRHIENRDWEATAWSLTGESFLGLKRFDEAAAFLQMAARAHRDVDNRWLAANDLRDLATALSAMGDDERARERLSEAGELLAAFFDPVATTLKMRIAREMESYSA